MPHLEFLPKFGPLLLDERIVRVKGFSENSKEDKRRESSIKSGSREGGSYVSPFQ